MISLAFQDHPGLGKTIDPAVPGKEFISFTYAEFVEALAMCVLLENLNLSEEPHSRVATDGGRNLGHEIGWSMPLQSFLVLLVVRRCEEVHSFSY